MMAAMENAQENQSRPADFGVIVPAAGAGARYGGDKLAEIIGGQSVLDRSLRAFLDRPDVASVVVCRDRKLDLPVSDEVAKHPKLLRCNGGETRDASVRRGLQFLWARAAAPRFVAVHDAARPLVSQDLIGRVFDAALAFGAAVPAVAVTDTIKLMSTAGGRRVERTLPRRQLVAVQTPQAMRADWLIQAYAFRDAAEMSDAELEEITDDAGLLEAADLPVRVVEGEAANLKLTAPGDLARLEALLSASPAP